MEGEKPHQHLTAKRLHTCLPTLCSSLPFFSSFSNVIYDYVDNACPMPACLALLSHPTFHRHAGSCVYICIACAMPTRGREDLEEENTSLYPHMSYFTWAYQTLPRTLLPFPSPFPTSHSPSLSFTFFSLLLPPTTVLLSPASFSSLFHSCDGLLSHSPHHYCVACCLSFWKVAPLLPAFCQASDSWRMGHLLMGSAASAYLSAMSCTVFPNNKRCIACYLHGALQTLSTMPIPPSPAYLLPLSILLTCRMPSFAALRFVCTLRADSSFVAVFA